MKFLTFSCFRPSNVCRAHIHTEAAVPIAITPRAEYSRNVWYSSISSCSESAARTINKSSLTEYRDMTESENEKHKRDE